MNTIKNKWDNKFSIIVPIYNVEKYLKKCLDSLINQTYNNFEVIAVCDKCSDSSEKILDDYIKLDKRIIKIKEEKTGLSKARNIGLKKVTGDYILFLDSDDFLELDLLKVLNEEIKKCNADIIRFQVQDIIDKKVIKHEEKPFDVTTGDVAFNYISKYYYIENAWCYLYKTSFWKKYNFKYMEYHVAEDFGLTPLIISKSKKVKSISYIGYNYVYRNGSLMNSNYENKIKRINDMLEQAEFLKTNLTNSDITFMSFVTNSLIYNIVNLKKEDYKKYLKVIKDKGYYNYLKNKSPKEKIKKLLLKINPKLYYKTIGEVLIKL